MTEFLYFLFYSFTGWVYETLLCSVKERRFVNRGFLTGPYCPIYGCGALIDVVLLRPFSNPLVLFLLSMALCSVLEYITSYLMEKIFHARWWDYSHMKFNLNGRICLLGALAFGAMSLVLVLFLHPLVVSVAAAIPPRVRLIGGSVLAAGFAADVVTTLAGLASLDTRLREFSAMLKEEAESAGIAFAERLKRRPGKLSAAHRAFLLKMSFQQRRTLRSFANFHSAKYERAVEELRALLAERVKNRKKTDAAGDYAEN